MNISILNMVQFTVFIWIYWLMPTVLQTLIHSVSNCALGFILLSFYHGAICWLCPTTEIFHIVVLLTPFQTIKLKEA